MLRPRLAIRFVHSERHVKDILVIGGGPAGLSLASSLSHSHLTKNLKVSVVDAQPITAKFEHWATEVRASQKPIENRVVSLTPKSVSHLEAIGAWGYVEKDRTMSYDEMRVWDGESLAAIDFDAWGMSSGYIGTMIENSNLQQALFHSNDTSASIVHAGVESIATSPGSQWPVVKLNDGSEIMARLLVGADGQNSPVRAFANIASRGWDYNRFGVVATLTLENENFRSIAYQRFLKSGPLAVLPLPDRMATLVWSTLPDRAQWLRKLDSRAMSAMVNAGTRLDMVDIDYLHTLDPNNTDEIVNEVEWRMEQRSEQAVEHDYDGTLPPFVESVDPKTVAAFPLKMRHADSYVGERVALVGDAAHATHPLSGQGLNMGQRDVHALVSAIERATLRGQDIGSVLALEPYQRECYAANHLIMGVNDKLHKLYSTDFWPVVKLRSVGLDVVNSLGWAKDILMRRAQ